MKPTTPSTLNDKVTGFSKILRWSLGISFMGVGIVYWAKGGWPAFLFGIAFFITGFFRPKRCLADSCSVPEAEQQSLL